MRTNLFLSAAMSAMIALMPLQTAMAQELPRNPADQVSVQERARPDYDPLGVRLGGFDLNASVGVGVTSTDNVFNNETEEDSDLITYVAPRASLASHWSRHALRFRAGGYANNHADFGGEDVSNYYVGTDGRLDVGRSSEIGAGASLNQDTQLREDPDIDGGPVEYRRDNLYLYGRHTFNRFRVTARIDQNTWDYEDQDFRDYDESVQLLRGEFAFTARLSAVAEVGANQREYDTDSTRDSDGNYYAAGVSFDFTNLMRGQALITQYEQDYDDPAIGTVDGTGFTGNLQWYPTQLTTVNLNASRTVEDSAFAGRSYVRTRLGAGVDHELRRNIILSAGARTEQREYEGIDRDDDLFSADVGATYIANRRMRFNVGYGYRQNDSSGADPSVFGEDFEENRLTAGVSFHL